MRHVVIFTFAWILFSNSIIAQQKPEVVIPNFNDKYSEYVKMLEVGKTDIDYREFRESFIESKQFIIAAEKSTKFKDLKMQMYSQMKKSNYQEIIKTTKAMLSINYTSMIAHKILRQTYKIIGDMDNAEKYKVIQFGLLKSIVKKGDGKTCETAWPVIQIEEEYFILEMMGAKLTKQSTIYKNRACDRMDVIIKGQNRTFYFEISKILEGYKNLGIK